MTILKEDGMFNFIKAVILVIILAIIGIGIYFWTQRAPIASRMLTKTLGTPVTIEEIDVSISFSSLTIRKLVIKNPPNSTFPNALSIESINLQASPFTFFKDVITIKEVTVDRPRFTVEIYNINGSDNNWSRMINKVTETGSDKQQANESQKKFVINQFLIKDMKFSFDNKALFSKPIELPVISKIQINGMGAKQPLTSNEVFNIIGSTLLSYFGKEAGYQAIMEGTKQLSGKLLQGIETGDIQGTIKSLGNISEEPAEAIQKTTGLFKKLFAPPQRDEKSSSDR